MTLHKADFSKFKAGNYKYRSRPTLTDFRGISRGKQGIKVVWTNTLQLIWYCINLFKLLL